MFLLWINFLLALAAFAINVRVAHRSRDALSIFRVGRAIIAGALAVIYLGIILEVSPEIFESLRRGAGIGAWLTVWILPALLPHGKER